mgnify:CR=1 FL=1
MYIICKKKGMNLNIIVDRIVIKLKKGNLETIIMHYVNEEEYKKALEEL